MYWVDGLIKFRYWKRYKGEKIPFNWCSCCSKKYWNFLVENSFKSSLGKGKKSLDPTTVGNQEKILGDLSPRQQKSAREEVKKDQLRESLTEVSTLLKQVNNEMDGLEKKKAQEEEDQMKSSQIPVPSSQ